MFARKNVLRQFHEGMNKIISLRDNSQTTLVINEARELEGDLDLHNVNELLTTKVSLQSKLNNEWDGGGGEGIVKFSINKTSF